ARRPAERDHGRDAGADRKTGESLSGKRNPERSSRNRDHEQQRRPEPRKRTRILVKREAHRNGERGKYDNRPADSLVCQPGRAVRQQNGGFGGGRRHRSPNGDRVERRGGGGRSLRSGQPRRSCADGTWSAML